MSDERNFDTEIRELQNTQRILKNLDRTIRNMQISGSESHNVAEGLNFLQWLSNSAQDNLENIQADKKAAAKASKDSSDAK